MFKRLIGRLHINFPGISMLTVMLAVLAVGLTLIKSGDSASSPVSTLEPTSINVGAKQPPNENGPPTKAPGPQLGTTLAALGFTESEVQVALEVEEQTGIPSLTFLEHLANGRIWAKVSMVSLKIGDLKPPEQEALDGPPIEEDAISTLMAQGHERLDILEAAGLARAYGKDIEEILQMRQADQSWRELAAELRVAQWEKDVQDLLLEALFDQESQTPAQFSRAEVVALLDKGVSLSDIITAVSVVEEFDVPFMDLLTKRGSGQTWPKVLDDTALLPRRVQIAPGGEFSGIISALGVHKPVQAEVMLARADYDALVALGLTPNDIHWAALIAQETTTSVLDVAARKTTSNTWVDVTDAVRQSTGKEGDR